MWPRVASGILPQTVSICDEETAVNSICLVLGVLCLVIPKAQGWGSLHQRSEERVIKTGMFHDKTTCLTNYLLGQGQVFKFEMRMNRYMMALSRVRRQMLMVSNLWPPQLYFSLVYTQTSGHWMTDCFPSFRYFKSCRASLDSFGKHIINVRVSNQLCKVNWFSLGCNTFLFKYLFRVELQLLCLINESLFQMVS